MLGPRAQVQRVVPTPAHWDWAVAAVAVGRPEEDAPWPRSDAAAQPAAGEAPALARTLLILRECWPCPGASSLVDRWRSARAEVQTMARTGRIRAASTPGRRKVFVDPMTRQHNVSLTEDVVCTPQLTTQRQRAVRGAVRRGGGGAGVGDARGAAAQGRGRRGAAAAAGSRSTVEMNEFTIAWKFSLSVCVPLCISSSVWRSVVSLCV